MKTNLFVIGTIATCSLFFLSCSKSDPVAPPIPLAPKLVKEVKTTETSNGNTYINTLVFEYNDKNQIIKKYYKETPSSYTTYTYSGDIPASSKLYANNVLLEEIANPIQVSGNTYTLLTVMKNGSGTNDSTFVSYTFNVNEIAEYRVLIKQPTMIMDMKNGYEYTSGILSAANYTSLMNGQQGSINTWAVKKTDDKSNPYLNAGRVNKVLMSIGQDPLARGKNNVQELEVTVPANGGTQTYTHTYDADGYTLTTTNVSGASTTQKAYIYTR